WGTIITLAACAAVCVTLYVGLSVSLHNEIDGFLEGEVQEFLSILVAEDDQPLEKVEADIRRELGSRERNDLTFRLLGVDGRLTLGSHGDNRLPDPWPLDNATLEPGQTWFETIDADPGTSPIRVCSMVARLPARGSVIVQATYSLDGVNAALGRFRSMCFIVLLLAAVGSVIGGRILARKSLRPVHEMSTAAAGIGARDLSRRLIQSGEEDELDHLAGVLNDMLERLERQVLRIRQFTADAAHELRTPLTALRGAAEVALGPNVSDERRRETLEESLEEFDRLSRLTDDLLLLAQADAGRAINRCEPVAINEAIGDVLELFSAVADEKRITINAGEIPPIEILADRERLRQVLCNLMDNAIKFTPAGGRIDVDASRREARVMIRIADTGVGIDEERLPHVFDRFYRTDAAR
ncbi:MAG: HAMP domain-containing protein, partial [Phycisphaerales bacterium]|nr:HAMP domain-containing protein [Phycisphaerales bacterium]